MEFENELQARAITATLEAFEFINRLPGNYPVTENHPGYRQKARLIGYAGGFDLFEVFSALRNLDTETVNAFKQALTTKAYARYSPGDASNFIRRKLYHCITRRYNYEIYTKNPETGERGWDIHFVNVYTHCHLESRKLVRTYPHFDCIILDNCNSCGAYDLTPNEMSAYLAGTLETVARDTSE